MVVVVLLALCRWLGNGYRRALRAESDDYLADGLDEERLLSAYAAEVERQRRQPRVSPPTTKWDRSDSPS